jgi:DNA anti-recombination protein RmuC
MEDSMRHLILLAGAATLLAACDGAAENAGEATDARNGEASVVGQGPAERMGARIDAARDSAEDAVEAQADAIRDKADLDAEKLEAEADRFEERAKQIRDDAKEAAKRLEESAER